METPLNSLVSNIVSKLDSNLREDFEERAAIMEYDAELPRAHAECLALLNVLHRNPVILTGVTAMQIEVNGMMQYWLVTDHESAQQHLSDIGGIEIGTCDLANVIDQQFSGIAVLASIK